MSEDSRTAGFGMCPTALVRAGNPYQTLVYLALATYANANSREAFPSMERIADETGVSRETVKRAVAGLEEAGWITVARKSVGEMKRGNRYWLHSEPCTQVSQTPVHDADVGSNKNHLEQELELLPTDSVGEHDPFDKFWDAYPKKTAKKDARKAYALALDEPGVNPSLLLAALLKQKGRWSDPKYIPYPATWLRRGHWSDEVDKALKALQPKRQSPAKGADGLYG